MGKVERRGGGVRVFERGKVGCEGWGWGWGGCRDLFDLPHEMRLVFFFFWWGVEWARWNDVVVGCKCLKGAR